MIVQHLKWYHLIFLAIVIYCFSGWIAGISHVLDQVLSGNVFGGFPGVMWTSLGTIYGSSNTLTIRLLLIPVNGILIYYLLKKQKLNFFSFFLVQISIDIVFLTIANIFFYGAYSSVSQLVLFDIIPIILSSIAAWFLLIRFLITENHNYIDSWINKLNKSTTLIMMLLLFIPELLMVIYWMIDLYLIPDEAGCFGSISITGPAFNILIVSLSLFLYLAMRPFLDKEERNRMLIADLKMSLWPILAAFLLTLIFLS